MTFEEVLQAILNFLRKLLGPLLSAIIIALLFKYVIPWILEYFFGAAAVSTGMFVIVLILVIIFILILIFDGGVLGSGPCALTKFRFKPDACVNLSCTGMTCVSVKGPYPKWMGRFTPATQDVGCICPSSLGSSFAAIAPYLQKLLDKAVGIKNQSDLQRLIEKTLTEEGINSEDLPELLKILQKLQRGEELSQEDIDKINKILKGSP